MKKKGIRKRVGTWALSLAVLAGILQPVPVKAAEEPLGFAAEHTYAAVAVESKKAVNIKQAGWQTHTTIDGTYVEESEGVEKTALLKIEPQTDQSGLEAGEIRVLISSVGLEDTYPLRAEGGNDYIFADADKRQDQYEYIVTKTADN